MELEVEGQNQAFAGKYCAVMRRGVDGQWRMALDVWNADSE